MGSNQVQGDATAMSCFKHKLSETESTVYRAPISLDIIIDGYGFNTRSSNEFSLSLEFRPKTALKIKATTTPCFMAVQHEHCYSRV